MKKVLVTGGSGFIGKAVIASLKNSDFEVHATSRTYITSQHQNVYWHKVNLLNSSEVKQLFSDIKPEYLIQLAWCTGQGQYWKDEHNIDWLIASMDIARNFVRNGGQRCLFAGTSAEYSWNGLNALDESTALLNPLLLYGGCKLGAYWSLTRYFEQEKTSFVWMRFFNPFGQGEDVKRLIPKTCLSLLSNQEMKFDEANCIRDFLHIDDVGSAILHITLSDVVGPVNVASGEAITIRQVIETIASCLDKSDKVIFDPTIKVGDTPFSVLANTRRLNVECAWHPQKTTLERIEETCQWWQHQYKNQK